MSVTQIINGETYIQIESNTIVSPGSPPILIPISTPNTEMTLSSTWQNCTAKTMSLAYLPTKSSRLGHLSRMPSAFMTLLRQVKSMMPPAGSGRSLAPPNG